MAACRPLAGIARLRHFSPDVQPPARVESLLLRGAGFLAGLLLYPAALWLYHNGITYVFVDFATGVCCLLEIVGVGGIIWRFGSLARVFGLVGAFSYGLYLIHQPYVIWLGLRIRPISPWLFLLVFVATLMVLSAWGILLEKSTNALVNKLVPTKKGE